jgi:hypothetical protein
VDLTETDRVFGVETGTLTVVGMTPEDAGSYRLKGTNGNGTAATATALITVLVPPVITSQPSVVDGIEGESAVLSVTFNANPAPRIQWYKDGQPLVGATDPILAVGSLSAADAGRYRAEVVNAVGSALSQEAEILFASGLKTEVGGELVSVKRNVLGSAQVVFPFGKPDWYIYYTTDGSTPSEGNLGAAMQYVGAFDVTESVTLWPIAFSPDFSRKSVGTPVRVNVLKPQELSVSGGDGLVHLGPAVPIRAESSTGLPVALAVVSGPGRLEVGNLIPTGGGVIRLRASQAGDDIWAPTSLDVERVVAPATPSITWTPISDRALGSAPVTLEATTSSGLPISYSVVSGPATVSGRQLTLTGAGTVVVRAAQAGNVDYRAVSADISFAVSKGTQTLVFPGLANRSYTTNAVTLVATASSGLPVQFEIVSGPAVVSGTKLSLTGVGTVVVRAGQPGNENYEPAVPKDQSFTVLQAVQALTFPAVGAKTFKDAPVTLSATSSAGLPITFRVVSGPGTLDGNQLTLTGAGSIVVEASQKGNDLYLAAKVNQTVTVAKAAQTLEFAGLSDRTFTPEAIPLVATASSGLTVGFRLLSGPATWTGSELRLTGVGRVVVAADQPGNADWLAASSITNGFTVARGVQTLAFAPIPDQLFGSGTITLSATSSAGLPVTFSVVSGPATVTGAELRLTGEGMVTVRASNAGTALWLPAQQDRTFQSAKGLQSIEFNPLADQSYGEAPFTLQASSSSGLPVAFRVVSGPAVLESGRLRLTGVGVVQVEASQSGNTSWQPAPVVLRGFSVSKGGQTLEFLPLADRAFTTNAVALTATSSSGLPVRFELLSGPATLSGNLLTFKGVGIISIRAIQSGSDLFLAAVPVERSFEVTRAPQSLDFVVVGARDYGTPPLTLEATSSSGLPVEFVLVSGPASLTGATLSLSGAGDVVVEAFQSGSDVYLPAKVNQTIPVGRGKQTISFPPLSNMGFTTQRIGLTATSSSGLSVTYRLLAGAATLDGAGLLLSGLGEVRVAADQPGNTNWLAAVSVTNVFAVSRGTQTISFTPIGARLLGGDPVSLKALSSAGLPVTFAVLSGPATLLPGGFLNLTGEGEVLVRALNPGDALWLPAQVDQSFRASKDAHVIGFETVSAKTYGDGPVRLKATSSLGQQVQFRLLSGPASLDGDLLAFTGAGPVEVEAFFPGSSLIGPASSRQTILVAKAAQSIEFPPLGDVAYTKIPIPIPATASSALPVALRVVSGPGTLEGNQLTLTGLGAVILEATQPGNADWLPATAVRRQSVVSKGPQSIEFPVLADRPYSTNRITLLATSSSGLPVEFEWVSGSATLQAGRLTLTGVGTVRVRARQPGNDLYQPAVPVERSFGVAQSSQDIEFTPVGTVAYGSGPLPLSARSSSGLPVTFRVVSGPASLTGSVLTPNGVGVVLVDAVQEGTDLYLPATARQSVTISRGSQGITFPTPGSRGYTVDPIRLLATASSGLPVVYRVVSGPATVTGADLRLSGLGEVWVVAEQFGDNNWLAAVAVTNVFPVVRGTQTIDFTPVGNQVLGSAPIPLKASSSAGLPVGFVVLSGPATVLPGGLLSLTGEGQVTVQAASAGNALWLPAQAEQVLSVRRLAELVVGVDGGVGGTVVIDPQKPLYERNETVTLTAVPAVGYRFKSWSGDLTGTENPARITMEGNRNVTAQFLALFPPVVTLLSPSPTDLLRTPTNVTLVARATDPDGVVVRVDFLAGAQLIGSGSDRSVTNTFRFVWTNAPVGLHRLTARAVDDNGITSTSSAVEIQVMEPEITWFRLEKTSYTVVETDPQVVIWVSKTGPGAGSVSYRTRARSAEVGRDYREATGTLEFAPDKAVDQIVIPLLNEYVPDGTRDLEVELWLPTGGARIDENFKVARVTIADDDADLEHASFLDFIPSAERSAVRGGLRVVLEPPGAGGQWRLPWESSWRPGGATVSNLDPGNYPVEFRPVAGWSEPVQTVYTITESGGLVVRTNRYEAAPSRVGGKLTVHLAPLDQLPTGRDAPGWRLRGEVAYQPSGATLPALPAGRHIIEFKPVDTWTEPPVRLVTVQDGLESVVTASYLLAGPRPEGVALPSRLPTYNAIRQGFSATPVSPRGLVGQIRTPVGLGSGIAVRKRVVLTAAHVIWDETRLDFVREIEWFHERQAGDYEPRPLRATGFYVFDEYAAARRRERVEGKLPPGVSGAESQRWDVAAIYFGEPAARGGQSGYLLSDLDPHEWLVGSAQKTLLGYPLTGMDDGRMHELFGANYTFTPGGVVLQSGQFLSYPGNSGGPFCAAFRLPGEDIPIYLPAGVYLGSSGGRSLVRAIDSKVASLINRAASSAELGTNFNGFGGVILGESTSGGGLFVSPSLAVRFSGTTEGGWRVKGDAGFIAGGVPQELGLGDFVLEFKPVAGRKTPADLPITLGLGQELYYLDVVYEGSAPPQLPQIRVNPPADNGRIRFDLSGPTGTVVVIEASEDLVRWTPLATNRPPDAFEVSIPQGGRGSFYRAVTR